MKDGQGKKGLSAQSVSRVRVHTTTAALQQLGFHIAHRAVPSAFCHTTGRGRVIFVGWRTGFAVCTTFRSLFVTSFNVAPPPIFPATRHVRVHEEWLLPPINIRRTHYSLAHANTRASRVAEFAAELARGSGQRTREKRREIDNGKKFDATTRPRSYEGKGVLFGVHC